MSATRKSLSWGAGSLGRGVREGEGGITGRNPLVKISHHKAAKWSHKL